jgi:AraC-like DNA-binding protein
MHPHLADPHFRDRIVEQAAVNLVLLAFLAELSFTLARHRIRSTRNPLAVVAEDIGYESEAGFGRAFRRRFGTAPGADRKEQADSAV